MYNVILLINSKSYSIDNKCEKNKKVNNAIDRNKREVFDNVIVVIFRNNVDDVNVDVKATSKTIAKDVTSDVTETLNKKSSAMKTTHKFFEIL